MSSDSPSLINFVFLRDGSRKLNTTPPTYVQPAFFLLLLLPKMKPLDPIWVSALILLLPFLSSVMSQGQMVERKEACSGIGPDSEAMGKINDQFRLENQTSKSATNYCSWKGVNCSGDCHVKELKLSSRNLSGTIPRYISQLTSLTTLDLSHNNLNGSLASVLGCSNLTHFSVSRNQINESIPEGFGKLRNLQTLDLSFNHLGGPIPDDIYDCISLQNFSVQGNNLTALKNPPPNHRWGKLLELDLSHNSFTGPIPAKVLNLSSLSSLHLSHNHFSGSLQEGGGGLTNLETLDISSNNLSGEIPSSLIPSFRRLNSLYLQNNNFSGNLPSNFVNLSDTLERLDLSNNNLSGLFPFDSFKNLQLLNLSNNDFEGQVPTGGIFDHPNIVSLVGNRKICLYQQVLACNNIPNKPPTGVNGPGKPNSTAPARTNSKSGLPKAVLAVIVVIAIAVFMFLLLGLLYKRKYFSNKNLPGRVKDISFFRAPPPELLTYANLETATQGFSSSNLIGSGTIGSVYRGILQQGKNRQVAVKVLHKDALIGDPKKLMKSSLELHSIKHRNLVKMIASCADVDSLGNQFAAWVYDLMPNGNLEMWLHEEVVFQAVSFRKWNLSWYQRLNMAIDVASALVRLHCKPEMPVVLCNLKPSNILIAEDLTACVADFGMVRHFPLNVVVKNSKGYVAPECENGNFKSPMCDVYSFGVILLEMFTGKRPTNEAFSDGSSLRKYVLERFHLGLEDILDPLLISEETDGKLAERARECLSSVIRLALLCSSESAQDRMEMAEALKQLEGIKGSFLEVGGNGVMPNRSLNHLDSTDAILNA